jgi:NADH-ubiquinone oxidoreductase chain 1
MIIPKYIISIFEILIVILPILITVAFITIAERKTMASMQRRLGPNIVGYYGLLQPFADALKLLIKEYIAPTQANIILFFLGPFITLIFSLYGYAMIPFGPGITINDFNLGLLYILAVSSLATYGILLAGWSANSKYAFLGSLRSTAQLISYELILSSALLLIVLSTGSLNLTVIIEIQKITWFIIPLLPLFAIFFIASIAETNRAPFDLAEAESELVSGFMTEHAAGIFVFFFLAEYASIILMCILITIVLLGGYEIFSLINILFMFLYNILNILITIISFSIDIFINYLKILISIISMLYNIFFDKINYDLIDNEIKTLNNFYNHINEFSSKDLNVNYIDIFLFSNNINILSYVYIMNLGIKSCILIFTYIWVRASYPRIRFDQLMSYCWTVLLPIIIAIIIFIPCILYNKDILPCIVSLL